MIHLILAKMCVGFYFLNFLQRFIFNVVPAALCDFLCPLYVICELFPLKWVKIELTLQADVALTSSYLFVFVFIYQYVSGHFHTLLNKDTYVSKTSVYTKDDFYAIHIQHSS